MHQPTITRALSTTGSTASQPAAPHRAASSASGGQEVRRPSSSACRRWSTRLVSAARIRGCSPARRPRRSRSWRTGSRSTARRALRRGHRARSDLAGRDRPARRPRSRRWAATRRSRPDTLCLDAVFVQHPALDGADGIALDHRGTIYVDANERNAIAMVDRDGRVRSSSATRPAPAACATAARSSSRRARCSPTGRSARRARTGAAATTRRTPPARRAPARPSSARSRASTSDSTSRPRVAARLSGRCL